VESSIPKFDFKTSSQMAISSMEMQDAISRGADENKDRGTEQNIASSGSCW
jgi:hypothetical protein